jgi:hypothetical protein
MHRPMTVTAALIIAAVAIAGATIDANSFRPGTTTQASPTIGIVQMMTSARDLPEERYDAY